MQINYETGCGYLEPDGVTCGASNISLKGRKIIPVARLKNPSNLTCPLASAPTEARRQCGQTVDDAFQVLRRIGRYLP